MKVVASKKEKTYVCAFLHQSYHAQYNQRHPTQDVPRRHGLQSLVYVVFDGHAVLPAHNVRAEAVVGEAFGGLGDGVPREFDVNKVSVGYSSNVWVGNGKLIRMVEKGSVCKSKNVSYCWSSLGKVGRWQSR